MRQDGVSEEPQGVEAYYTDVEHLRDLFKNMIAAPVLSKRLLTIYGVGGAGKSSLLRMFRLHCKSMHVPVALASGDDPDVRSAVDVLVEWTNELKALDVNLPSFAKDHQHRRALQAKVDSEASKVAHKAGTAAAKTATETVLSTIPGLGPVLGKLGGIGVEALMDWLLSKGFSKPDVDLLLDPEKRLTDDFLIDLVRIAPTQRIVLMLDTYEQMAAFDDWTREFAERVHPNVLLVIAGREMVNWDRLWPGWLAQTEPHALEPMTPEVMRELVRRYYNTQIGGQPDPAQVEKIVRFARGLPMAVTTAVRLWVKYRHEVSDFDEVEASVLDELVRRLREGVPSTIIPALEAAATVRYFNKEILRAVTGREDVSSAYDELRRFPFIKGGKEGTQPILRLHDSVREFLDRSMEVDDPERYRELHGRAATYFEVRLARVTGEEGERLRLEHLYHRIRANEESGMRLFQEVAEQLASYHLVAQLHRLLNDAETYPFTTENGKRWRDYYRARKARLESRFDYARITYQSIADNDLVEPKLQAYALCDLGEVLRVLQQHANAISALERGLSLVPVDSKLAYALTDLSGSYRRSGDLERALACLKESREFYEKSSDAYGMFAASNRLKYFYLNQGRIREAVIARNDAAGQLPSRGVNTPYLRMELLGRLGVAWAWFGSLHQTEYELNEAFNIARESGMMDALFFARDLGYVTGMSDKFSESVQWFTQSVDISARIKEISEFEDVITAGFRGAVYTREGRLEEAHRDLSFSFQGKQNLNDVTGIPEVGLWFGQLLETRANARSNNYLPETELRLAENCYRRILNYRWVGRRHFECGALTGLVRVKHAQGDHNAIPSLLAEAEQLARQYEYNDHLASQRLTQAHLSWDDQTYGVPNNVEAPDAFEGTRHFYQEALVLALRYNRFLLDEVLKGRPQGSPLYPIIPYCLERGEEGRRLLMALRNWWQIGINDIGTLRPDTISPIPEAIPLLEAERMARQREPGDGSSQTTVLQALEAALT